MFKKKKENKKDLSQSFVKNNGALILNDKDINSYAELLDYVNSISDPLFRAAAMALIAYFGITQETFNKANKRIK